MKKKVIVTKDKIRKYLKLYNNLNTIIKNRELTWILEKGPSFQEWEIGKNTVEQQAMKLIGDNKLNEMRFYKENLNKYLFILKTNYEKQYYEYIVCKYFKKSSKEQLKKMANSYKIDLHELDETAMQYLYVNLRKEAKYIE